MMDRSTWFTPAATFVVLAGGVAGKRIARTAQEHAEFDPEFRRVLCPGDALYPSPSLLDSWSRRGAAALVVNPAGEVCALLDPLQACSAPWIENAFLQARSRAR